MGKSPDRRLRDPNQLGKLMVDIMSGEMKDTISPSKKDLRPPRDALAGSRAVIVGRLS